MREMQRKSQKKQHHNMERDKSRSKNDKLRTTSTNQTTTIQKIMGRHSKTNIRTLIKEGKHGRNPTRPSA